MGVMPEARGVPLGKRGDGKERIAWASQVREDRPGKPGTGNILVTGKPGCGKTTLVLRVVEGLTEVGFKAGGFVTEEMRRGRSRIGFRVRDLAGGSEVLAHVERGGLPRVGRYGVDTEAFERVALRSLRTDERDVDLLVVDEIGRMELLSPSFRAFLPSLFDSPLPLLATVHAGGDPFTRGLMAREDVSVLRLSASNREECIRMVREALLAILGGGGVRAEPEGGTET
ncbi:MAG: NTPase [Actinobacteria bacterium]|nr:NTPase [Actinomycetota bacterium]